MSIQFDKHHPSRDLNHPTFASAMSALNSAVPSKRLSRSNSTSSSMTVKKPASLSSRTGIRTSIIRGRSTSPDSISKVLTSLNGPRQYNHSRPRSSERRKTASFNVNRWSHSTSSSISGLESDLIRKRTSSSGATRRSIAGFNSSNSIYTFQEPNASQASPKRSPLKRSSGGVIQDGSRLNFQDSSHLNMVRNHSPTTSASNTDFFNPAWEHRTGFNKFGQPVQGVSLQYTSESVPPLSSSPTRLGHRDRATKRSKDSSKGSLRSVDSDQSRGKGHRSPKQKDMLSKALAMANNAVLLDNAQNITGAIEAYNDACVLLEQVMVRSSDMEDRRKLSAIRTTYSNRIAELHDLDDSFADLLDKTLPDDPMSDEYEHPEDFYHDDSSFHARTSTEVLPSRELPPVTSLELPARQESLLPQIFGGNDYLQNRPLQATQPSINHTQLTIPMDAQYMPPPLSPRHPPVSMDDDLTPVASVPEQSQMGEVNGVSSTSWLENFDSSSSTKSSSRLSSIDFGNGDSQLVSDIQAEFDAAMNAAVDSAYDDEITQELTPRETVRSIHIVNNGAPQIDDSLEPPAALVEQPVQVNDGYLDDEAAEEERLLDEMTKDYVIENTGFDNNRRALPRESDSSGFSSRTWNSSMASTTATSGTTLSTLAEGIEPSIPIPIAQSPPQVLMSRQPSQPLAASSPEKHVPIRDRRMSAQSAKQLKIETFTRRNSVTRQTQQSTSAPPTIEVMSEVSPFEVPNDLPSFAALPSVSQPLTPLTSVTSGDSHHGESPATPALTPGGSIDDPNIPTSPSRLGKMMPPPRPLVRKNVSTSSLKKGLSINTGTDDNLESPGTPHSAAFSNELRRQPSNSSPAGVTPVVTSGFSGGMYLFEDQTGGNGPHIDNSETHSTLEPCPDSFLLRPFWLMRCLCSALSHPEGGYVTQKLFLSRDIWRVRNVKFKALDEKISTCDLLTAALQKLAKVDTLDAAAVLDEVQSLEAVLDQVRNTLSKKLGSDVGLSGSAAVFKTSPAGDDTNELMTSKSANASSAAKSIASGWRKLRSKSSNANMNSGSVLRDVAAQNFTMSSLPMTTSSSVATSRSYLNRSRDPLPTPAQLPNMLAPQAEYLCSLARLFNAVQILDSIARQVEDPGLKYSSKTHVGLELSMRSAADFFAFYVLRFVMGDLLMLVDKFLKRGTEWVMT